MSGLSCKREEACDANTGQFSSHLLASKQNARMAHRVSLATHLHAILTRIFRELALTSSTVRRRIYMLFLQGPKARDWRIRERGYCSARTQFGLQHLWSRLGRSRFVSVVPLIRGSGNREDERSSLSWRFPPEPRSVTCQGRNIAIRHTLPTDTSPLVYATNREECPSYSARDRETGA